MTDTILSTGDAAAHLKMPTWRLLNWLDRGLVPEPALHMRGRRVFTIAEVERIAAAIEDKSKETGEA